MSKSRRVFLSMQDDDDFWGNGDRFEEEEKKKKQARRRIQPVAEEEEDEGMEEKYFFKQNGPSEESKAKDVFAGNRWKCLDDVKSGMEENLKMFTEYDEKSGSSPESNDFYAKYRNYFRVRPEVHFLVRSMTGQSPENFDNKFIDLYEETRKALDQYPHSHISQILRRNVSPNMTETRVRSRHAVVVSNFREPDRRLGRYSKYYYHHNVGPEVYSRKVFVGGLPACVTEGDILGFFSRYGRLHVDWPSKHYGSKSDSDPSVCNESISHLAPPFGQVNPFDTEPRFGGGIGSGVGCLVGPKSEGSTGEKRQSHLGYVFLLFEKERSVRDLVSECFEEEEGLFINMESSLEPIRVQIRPWLLADAEFLMDFHVPINTKLVAFIGGVPRPLKAVELAHFFEQTYGSVVCVGIDIDNKFKYPRGSGRVAFSNYEAYVQAITDRYIVLDHEDIHKRVEIKPYFFHNQSCEECSGRYHRQHAPYFCPSLECFQYYCEGCWQKMHSHPSRFHHMPVVKGI